VYPGVSDRWYLARTFFIETEEADLDTICGAKSVIERKMLRGVKHTTKATTPVPLSGTKQTLSEEKPTMLRDTKQNPGVHTLLDKRKKDSLLFGTIT